MLSDKSTVCPINLLDIAHQKRGVKAAIVNAGKTLPMLSVMDAVKENLIEPVFIGDEIEIKKTANDLSFDVSEFKIIDEKYENNTAKVAAKLASDKQIKIIVKGHIHTDVLMKEVFKREYNLIGKTFNAPSVIISGLSSLSKVICHIWLSLVFPNKLYSLLRTSFIKTSV